MGVCRYQYISLIHCKNSRDLKLNAQRYSASTSNHVLSCSLYRHPHKDVLGDFPRICNHLPKTFQKLSEGYMIVNIFPNLWRLPRISKDLQKLLKKIQKCFDRTTNLNMMLVKSSISSLVKICKIRHPSPCVIIILFKFWVEYFPVKHLLLYKYYKPFHWY